MYSYTLNNILKIVLSLCLLLTTLYATKKDNNMLQYEESPYLQQHANSTVNWYAWNNQTLKKAQDENKLIFLSIGYSTCHWCHVMDEESFKNQEVAKVLNDSYISIKIDREEMPHIDKYYQDLHAMLKGKGGGWPLNVILTPNKKAFFMTTYIPMKQKKGKINIKELLLEIQISFQVSQEKIYAIAQEMDTIFGYSQNPIFRERDLDLSIISRFVDEINNKFDHENGGIGKHSKFPHASTIITLLDIYSVKKNKTALNLAKKMLDAMAKGGIYDQIEGGFYRYSIDKKWNIPQFEKMLYTNAELLEAYTKAYLITKDLLYKDIANGIISSTKERFEHNHLLYSAIDANSLHNGKKVEGYYYTFSLDKTSDFLKTKGYSNDEISKILKYFNITPKGNFKNNQNNPYINSTTKLKNIAQIKKDLKELREQKQYPFIDKKILTSWNAMYISSLLQAKSLNKQNATHAIALLDNLIKNLYINNTLYHQRLVDKKPKVKALFEDYSFLIDTLLKAYNSSLDTKYLTLAKKLTKEAKEQFYKDNKWLMSNDKLNYKTNTNDTSHKSALSTMVNNFLKLAILTEDLNMQKFASKQFGKHSFVLDSQPSSHAGLIGTYLRYKKQYIVVKASKEKLQKETLIDYPFTLKKIDTHSNYIACTIGICFSINDEYGTVIKDIQSSI
jgi:uncharacterized protein YyaL (SSP411 family)